MGDHCCEKKLKYIRGPQGVRGPVGPIGFTGPQGFTGPTGSVGLIGPTGFEGPVGFTGPQGSDGFTGPQGPDGFTGPQGLLGQTGFQGPTGIRGNTGLMGPTGAQGLIGTVGAQGVKGFTGPTGFFVSSFDIVTTERATGIYVLPLTDITFFNYPASFNLGRNYINNLPPYFLPDGVEGQIKNLQLINPLSGNVMIQTNQGSFNLTFTDNNTKLAFINGRWISMDSTVSNGVNSWYSTFQKVNLTGTGSTGLSVNQGVSVALSADGNTLAVGGPNDNNGIGAVWIFIRSGGVWIQQTKLIGSSNIGTSFQGTSVSLSADGNNIAIGGYRDNNGIGATWIFTRSGVIWTEQTKLIGSGNINAANQGRSVSLSADGNTLAIGGNRDNNNIGATWIFVRFLGVWTQQIKLIGSGNISFSQQGYSVSLSSDGNTLAVGAIQDNDYIGATWIFIRSEGIWTQQSKLIGLNNVGKSNQGYSINLSSDGNTLAVGGQGDNNNGNIGATWIFVRLNNIWIQQQKIAVLNNIVNEGRSVRLSSDGNTLAIGFNDNLSIGGVFIFTRVNGKWIQQGLGLTNGVSNINQGTSVALSADGNILASGAPDNNNNIGSVLIFT
jgi:hypothetical protein